MMKHEFEELAGYTVSKDDYYSIIEPMYMATNMSKADFVKCIDKKRFAQKPAPKETPVFVSDMTKTPNGCYYIGKWFIQIGEPKTSIRTGKTTYTVRETTNREQLKIGWDEWLASHVDLNTLKPTIIVKDVNGKRIG